jgi:tRNA (guanosine-2'-O-)-methyltransferase
MGDDLLTYLASYVTKKRQALFDKVLSDRTRYITVVLEDIYQSQNASAVLRTCDCFGIQDVHVIENRNEFNVNNEVALGASKWLSITKYNQEQNNSLTAINSLKEKGYRIIATTPHSDSKLLPDFDLTKGKAALVFGSELPGVTTSILDQADEFLKIPMYGFTESFNISVSVAIILNELSGRLRKFDHKIWKLNEAEKKDLKLQWIKNTVKASQQLEELFFKKQQKNP